MYLYGLGTCGRCEVDEKTLVVDKHTYMEGQQQFMFVCFACILRIEYLCETHGCVQFRANNSCGGSASYIKAYHVWRMIASIP